MDENKQHPKSLSPTQIEAEDEDTAQIQQKRKRRTSRRENMDEPTMLTAPSHVHGTEWKDMLSIVDILQQPKASIQSAIPREILSRSRANTRVFRTWIEDNISKRECSCFIPTLKYLNKCGCGLTVEEHSPVAMTNGISASMAPHSEDTMLTASSSRKISTNSGERPRWSIKQHTVEQPTDAYGSIQFEGGGHNKEARYARVAFDTPPDVIVDLLCKLWKLRPPKIIITLHGGQNDFELQPKLARALRRGLMKAAQSTDAWIITSGTHQGVVKQLCEALTDLKSSRKSKARAIGIAPWGLIKKKNRLIGQDAVVKMNMNLFTKGRLTELDESHTHFLLADNGTAGRYGAEIVARRRLEAFLATGFAPIVCLVIEGGTFTIKAVNDYLLTLPSIPVVVCDGSGRAADLLSITHQHRESLPDDVRDQLLDRISQDFGIEDVRGTAKMLLQARQCAEEKMMTIFRLDEGIDLDHLILTTLLKSHNMTPGEQFHLAVLWNREDIARQEIFGQNVEWTENGLHDALMDALMHDKPDFVHLILEQGVSMENFMTFERLEKLYNTELGPHHMLQSLTRSCRKVSLPQIGHVIERLVGSNYNSSYTSCEFLARYSLYRQRRRISRTAKGRAQSIASATNDVGRGKTIANLLLQRTREDEADIEDNASIYQLSPIFLMPASFHLSKTLFTFPRPFHELLVWSVLTKRRKMARLMWSHGMEGLAKALIAARLFTALAKKASEDYMQIQLRNELRECAEEFQVLATELLEACYKESDDLTIQLLTYELTNWGGFTCLSLAALNDNMDFMKQPCPQSILTDLWNGGMQIRTKPNWLVIGALAIPPFIFGLEFKSKEAIRGQPHTIAEQHKRDGEGDSDSMLSSDGSSDDDSESDVEQPKSSRATSFSRFMNAARRSFRKEDNDEDPERSSQTIQHLATTSNIFTAAPAGLSIPTAKEGVVSRSDTLHKVHRRKKRQRRESNVSIVSRTPITGATPTEVPHSFAPVLFTYEADEKDYERTKATPISWPQKLYEFYNAPITIYWFWTAAFTVFQILLAYILLVKTPEHVRPSEYYVLAYVIVFGCDLIRKFIHYEERPFSRKLRLFFIAFKNGTSLIAVIIHVIGFIMRLSPNSRQTGRVIIIANSVLWSFKMLDLFWVHRAIGPYITTASEMIPRTLGIMVMVFVCLLSFGIVRQSIMFPNEEWDWLLVRNIFLYPYYMMYGEVYAEHIDECGEKMWEKHMEEDVPLWELRHNYSDPEHCTPGHWVSPLYMVPFMLIVTSLLFTTLVACCVYVYEHRVLIVRDIWLFERYGHVLEYRSKPFLPPPFTIISHVWLVLRYLWGLITGKKRGNNALKIFLREDQLSVLHRFENECLEDMEIERERKKQNSRGESMARVAQRNEEVLNSISALATSEITTRETRSRKRELTSTLEEQTKSEISDMRRVAAQVYRLLDALSASSPTRLSPILPDNCED